MKKLTQAEYEARIAEIFPDLEVIGEYVNAHTPIKIRDKYGILLPLALHPMYGRRPTITVAENPNAYFEAMAKELHPEYEYSRVDYINAYEPVIIICPIHGEFEQTPMNHLGKSATGCPACRAGLYSPYRAEKHKAEWQQEKASVYILECWGNGEHFYKVGITRRSVKQRFSGGNGLPYDYRLLAEFETNLYTAVYAEKAILRSQESYRPKLSFYGITECYICQPSRRQQA